MSCVHSARAVLPSEGRTSLGLSFPRCAKDNRDQYAADGPIADRLPYTAIRERAAASLAQLPEALRGLATADGCIRAIFGAGCLLIRFFARPAAGRHLDRRTRTECSISR